MDISGYSVPFWAIAAPVALLLLAGFVVWSKGRPFAQGAVFRASRMSGGNRLLRMTELGDQADSGCGPEMPKTTSSGRGSLM